MDSRLGTALGALVLLALAHPSCSTRPDSRDARTPGATAQRLGLPPSFEEPRSGLRFVLVPGDEELEPFYLCETEVTNAAFLRFDPHHISVFGGLDQPVDMVSLSAARAFIEWLGPGFRLPTEREWEHACRARTTTAYSFGDEFDHARANAAAGDPRKPQPGNRTRPVRSYAPNAWGLYDMHGNVMEWCAPEPPDVAVARGGSWRYGLDLVRSDGRWSRSPDGDPDTGFRPVRALRGFGRTQR